MIDYATELLRSQFDRRLRLRFCGAKVTSDIGLLTYRELDDALDLIRTAAGELQDHRTDQKTQHTATAEPRHSICNHLAGYEDLNDAERLRFGPTMGTTIGGWARHHPVDDRPLVTPGRDVRTDRRNQRGAILGNQDDRVHDTPDSGSHEWRLTLVE